MKLMSDHTDDWDEYLDPVLFGIRTSVQESTKFTPFFLMYGCEACFPLEVEKSAKPSISYDLADIDQVVSRLTTVKTTIFPTAEKNILASQKRQKELHKRRRNFHQENFKVGSLVLRMNMKQQLRKGSKLEDKWLGPYRVLDVTQYGCCKLACVRTGVVLKAKVNQGQLKIYQNPVTPKASALTAEGSPPKDSVPEVGNLTTDIANVQTKLLSLKRMTVI